MGINIVTDKNDPLYGCYVKVLRDAGHDHYEIMLITVPQGSVFTVGERMLCMVDSVAPVYLVNAPDSNIHGCTVIRYHDYHDMCEVKVVRVPDYVSKFHLGNIEHCKYDNLIQL
jgi:hypothetical protein